MRLARNWDAIEAKSDVTSDLTLGKALELLALPRPEVELRQCFLPELLPNTEYLGIGQEWGKRYAPWVQFLRSFGWLIKPLANRLGFEMDLAPDRFFCSEFVMLKLRQAGYTGEGAADPAITSPAKIIELPCLHRRGRLILEEDE